MSFLHHWDEEDDSAERETFIRDKAEELRYDSSMVGGHYRDFEQEAKDAWNRRNQ